MTKSTGAFLDGEPLTDFEDVQWGLSEGVVPLQAQFTVTKEGLARLLESARKRAGSRRPFTTLQFISQVGQGATKAESIVYKNIYITGFAQHQDPRLKYVTIADSRIFWSYSYFRGAFNVRTAAGDKFAVREVNLAGLGDVPLIVQDAISFKTYSLFPPIRDRAGNIPLKTWKISQILKKILGRIDTDLRHDTRVDFATNNNPLKGSDTQLQEDIFLDSSSSSSLSNVLDLIPYIGIYTDYDGVVKFFNKHEGGEIGLLNQITAKTNWQEPGNVPLYVTNELVAPRAVEVQFDSEIEMRFDFKDTGDTADLFIDEKEGRWLENVIQVPDPVIDLPGVKAIPRALHGQYLNLHTYLEALGPVGELEGVLVTEKLVREYLMNGLMDYNLAGMGEADFRADWAQRSDAITAAYRRKFRINKNFQDRIINLTAKRVATIDFATGARSPSPVFTNYSTRFTARGLRANGGEETIVNIRGYRDLINESKVCPLAILNILEVENGIFDINYINDPLGHNLTTYPSFVVNAPTWGLGDPLTPHFFDEGARHDKSLNTALSEEHFLSTILTCTPAPTSGSSLFSITVKPNEIGQKGISSKIPSALGPVYKVKVSPNIQTARFAWDDDLADEFDEALESEKILKAVL